MKTKNISGNTLLQKTTSAVFDHPEFVINSWADNCNIVKEQPINGKEGLRTPQVGAIYAALAHWATSNDVATIVLPTGTGKTETMLTLLVKEQCKRVLVIVPTDPLREQISNKFSTLGILKELKVVGQKSLLPVVGVFKKGFSDTSVAADFFSQCNVMVATASIVAQSKQEVLDLMKGSFSHVFIDEAHHSEAKSWFGIREEFSSNIVLQFTATPFRNDGNRVGGKIIFDYPLRKAQAEGYFRPITFKPVYEHEIKKKDRAIAEMAVHQLLSDRKNNYSHILMARTGTQKRADEIIKLYEEFDGLRSVVIHSGLPANKRKEVKDKILKKTVDIVVCVDMLGEGFDLPELKIAAFHDIRKSLPITLQLAGRFTRSSRDNKLGNATFVANVFDPDVSIEIDELYAQDADWNTLLPALSEKKTTSEIEFKDFMSGFRGFKGNRIPLQNLKPAMSTVIFKNHTSTWNPVNFREGLDKAAHYEHVYDDFNKDKHVLVIVTGKKDFVSWGNLKEIYNLTWDLYIIYWDVKQNLLFIHSSDTGTHHQNLAKAIIGDTAELITGNSASGNIFRCLHGVKRLKLQNVGLSEHLGKLIRFVMRVGSDIEPALTQAQRNKAKKSVIFGAGYESGTEVSIGCSYKGRIWSRRVCDFEALIKWFEQIGKKVLDVRIDADKLLEGTLTPVSVSSIPKKQPICIDWPDEVYQNSETKFSFRIDDTVYEFFNSELTLISPSNDGAITIGISNGNAIIAEYEMVLFKGESYNDFKFSRTKPTDEVMVIWSNKEINVEQFFYKWTPTIWFADGSSLQGNSYITLKENIAPYDRNKIVAWNWTGVDLKKESQGVEPKRKDSIQYYCLQKLKQGDYDLIYDDDGSGEIADILTFKKHEDKLMVELYHLKYASNGKVSNNIKNLYEVCGQAHKSVHWKHKESKRLISHLIRRETKKYKGNECSRIEKGTKEQLINLLTLAKVHFPLDMKIYIVQPSISKTDIKVDELTLLAVTENYLMEKAMIELVVIGSASKSK